MCYIIFHRHKETYLIMFKALSPLRHLRARLLDFLIWDDIRQMSQMKQLLHVWRWILLQESGHSVSPCGDRPPVPPLHGSAASVNAGQQLLEEVLTEDQTVPTAGL